MFGKAQNPHFDGEQADKHDSSWNELKPERNAPYFGLVLQLGVQTDAIYNDEMKGAISGWVVRSYS